MKSGIILSFILILGVIAISGCTDENTTKYYDTVDISFQYPADWTISEELTITGEGISGEIQTWHPLEGESFEDYVNLTKPAPQYIQKEGLMRGRQSAAMLTILGVPELIARDRADYLAIARRLVTDLDWRLLLAERIRAQGERLFNVPSAILRFQEILQADASPAV